MNPEVVDDNVVVSDNGDSITNVQRGQGPKTEQEGGLKNDSLSSRSATQDPAAVVATCDQIAPEVDRLGKPPQDPTSRITAAADHPGLLAKKVVPTSQASSLFVNSAPLPHQEEGNGQSNAYMMDIEAEKKGSRDENVLHDKGSQSTSDPSDLAKLPGAATAMTSSSTTAPAARDAGGAGNNSSAPFLVLHSGSPTTQDAINVAISPPQQPPETKKNSEEFMKEEGKHEHQDATEPPRGASTTATSNTTAGLSAPSGPSLNREATCATAGNALEPTDAAAPTELRSSSSSNAPPRDPPRRIMTTDSAAGAPVQVEETKRDSASLPILQALKARFLPFTAPPSSAANVLASSKHHVSEPQPKEVRDSRVDEVQQAAPSCSSFPTRKQDEDGQSSVARLLGVAEEDPSSSSPKRDGSFSSDVPGVPNVSLPGRSTTSNQKCAETSNEVGSSGLTKGSPPPDEEVQKQREVGHEEDYTARSSYVYSAAAVGRPPEQDNFVADVHNRRGSSGSKGDSTGGSLAVLQSAASFLAQGVGSAGTEPRHSLQEASTGNQADRASSPMSTSNESPDSSSSNSSSSSEEEEEEENDEHSGTEESSRQMTLVVEPDPNDILCGRGRGFFCHPGNRRMLEIVQVNKPRYKAANKTRKTEIVREVTDEIEMGGSRFLKRYGRGRYCRGWLEVSASEKHKKVCHCLREEKNDTGSPVSDLESAGAPHFPATGSLDRKRKQRAPPAIYKPKMPKRTVVAPRPGSPETTDENSKKSLIPIFPRYANGEAHGKATVALASTENDFTARRAEKRQSATVSEEVGSDSANRSHLGRPVHAATGKSDINGRAATLQRRKGLDRPSTSSTKKGRVVAGDEVLSSNVASLLGREKAKARAASGAEGVTYLAQHLPLAAEHAAARSNAQEYESNLDEKYGIVVGEPRPSDVLFGQDPTFYSHLGNIHLRKMIQGSVGYPAISAHSKLVLAQRIVAEMKFTGTRFLTRHRNTPPGLWYRIEDIEAETLIFRCLDEEEIKILSMFSGGQEPPAVGQGHAESAWAHISRVQEERQRLPESNSYVINHNHTLTPALTPAAAKTSTKNDDSDSPMDSDGEPEDEGGLATSDINGLPAPGPYDVICGRGRGNFRHPGNRRMLRMFWNVKAKYNKGTKMQKTMIGRAIVQDIKSKGGRFLKRAGNRWEEVERKIVLRKVCHGIRDIPNDPEKRKRSIVADELDDSDFSDAGKTTEQIAKKKVKEKSEDATNVEAPWLASRAMPATVATMPSSIPRKKSLPKAASGSGDEADLSADVPLINLKRPKKKALKFKEQSMLKKKSSNSGGGKNKSTNAFPQETSSALIHGRSDQIQTGGSIVQTPEATDVAIGRGILYQHHPGNMRMTQIISQNTPRYKAATSKSQRIKIIKEILDVVQSNGIRFLKRIEVGKDAGNWEVASFPEALEKVSAEFDEHLDRSESLLRYNEDIIGTAASPSFGAIRATGGNRGERAYEEYLLDRGPRVYNSSAFAPEYERLAGTAGLGGTAPLVGGRHSSLVLAARQQAEAEAAAGSRRLTPQEQIYLFRHGGGGGMLSAADLMVLQEQERHLSSLRRFL